MFFKRAIRQKGLIVSLLIVVGLVCGSFLVSMLGLMHPLDIDLRESSKAPSAQHVFGTDSYGRDLFARVVYGVRLSSLAAILVTIIASVLGGVVGMIAGFRGGVLDEVLSRGIDIMMAFPPLLLAIALLASMGAGFDSLVTALSIVYIPRIARVTRSAAKSIASEDFITAASAQGAGFVRTLLWHVLPGVFPILLTQATVYMAQVMVWEGALSFLGLGIPQPIPSLGNILAEGRGYLRVAPWISIFPGFTITILVLSINIIGDTALDLVDPRMKGVMK